MGGCATKPRDLKAEGDAPPPVEKPAPAAAAEETKKEAFPDESGAEADQADEGRRRSLGVLFKENEESTGSVETEKNVIEESLTPPVQETEEEVQPKREDSSVPPVQETKEEEVQVPPVQETKEEEVQVPPVQETKEEELTSDESKPKSVVEEPSADESKPKIVVEEHASEENKPKIIEEDPSNSTQEESVPSAEVSEATVAEEKIVDSEPAAEVHTIKEEMESCDAVPPEEVAAVEKKSDA
ncbi:uncharacterized protein [Typha latifolia]|uniref:uncharacterized protein n=1 Tax=Typha latifolia TaxID=4733 RepID=UPI003C2ABCCC